MSFKKMKTEYMKLTNELEDNQLSAGEIFEIMTITNRGLVRKTALTCMEEELMDQRPAKDVTIPDIINAVVPPYQSYLFRSDPDQVGSFIGVGNFCGAMRLITYNAILDYQEKGSHDPTPMLKFSEDYKLSLPIYSDFLEIFQDPSVFPACAVETGVLAFLDALASENNCPKHADPLSRFNQSGCKMSALLNDRYDVHQKLSENLARLTATFAMALAMGKMAGAQVNTEALQAVDGMSKALLDLIPGIGYFDDDDWARQLKQIDREIELNQGGIGKYLARYGLVVSMSNALSGFIPWNFDDLERITLTLGSAAENYVE